MSIKTIKLKPSDAVIPSSGGCGEVQNDGTNLSWDELLFDDTVDEVCDFVSDIAEYDTLTDVTVNIYWLTSAISGDVVWEVSTRGVEDDTLWDSAISVSNTVVAPANGTAETLIKSQITLTTPYTTERQIQVKLKRVATDGNDNMTGDARMIEMIIDYTVV